MSSGALQVGDVITASFPEQSPQGREQEGLRPAIVVGFPEDLGNPRFPILLVIPLTTYREQRWVNEAPQIYPRLPAGVAGLQSESVVLVDQLRALDANRVGNYRGRLSREQYEPILNSLRVMLRLSADQSDTGQQ